MQEGAELGELANLGTTVSPLFPVAHTHPAAQPVVEFGYGTIHLRYPEISHPAAQILGQLEQTVFHGKELRIPPGSRLEVLSGDRKGEFSIRINEQYRICFKWSESGPYDVEVTDYH